MIFFDVGSLIVLRLKYGIVAIWWKTLNGALAKHTACVILISKQHMH